MMTTARRTGVIAAASLLLLLGWPADARAQKARFADALVTFHSALFGTYGDEGPEVVAALEEMSAAFDVWEASRQAAEAALRQQAGTTAADRALLEADHQRFDAAIAAMREAVAAEPARAPLHVFLGRMYEAVGLQQQALEAFQAARAADPSDPVAAYLVASRLLAADPGQNAVGSDVLRPLVATLLAAAERGARLTIPSFGLIDDLSARTGVFAPVAYESGFALVGERRYREAIASFRRTLARDPLISDRAVRDDQVRRGIAALRERRGQAAVAELEAAAVRHPSSSEMHRVLGIVYRAVGRLPDSIARFREAVRLAPEDERANVALGSALIENEQFAEAERVMREALTRLPASGDARWQLAELLERLNRSVEALRLLQEATALIVPAGKAHLFWRIAEIAHARQRDHALVLDVLTRRRLLVPNQPHAHKDLGLAYSRAGRDEAALLELLMTRLLGYEDADTLAATGQVHLNDGRLAQAEAALARAVVLDAKHLHARYALARVLQRLGRAEDAAEQLRAYDALRRDAFEEQRRAFEREAAR